MTECKLNCKQHVHNTYYNKNFLLLLLLTVSHQVAWVGLKFDPPTITLAMQASTANYKSAPPCLRQQKVFSEQTAFKLSQPTLMEFVEVLYIFCTYVKNHFGTKFDLKNTSVSITVPCSAQNTECQTHKQLQKFENLNQGTSSVVCNLE